MLRFASKYMVRAALIVAAISLTLARAESSFTGAVGVDVWSTPDTQVRYLPNYSTPNEFRPANPWVRVTAQHRTNTDAGLLTLTAQGQTDPMYKGRIDRLDADLRTQWGGLRAGILPYRVSWCRGRDNGPWQAEPDAFCRFAGLNEISEGAAGVQFYQAALVAGWQVDTMAGAYRPLVDGQNTKLGPYVPVGPTTHHHSHGASLNGLHLATGTQGRVGWLRTDQRQTDASGAKSPYDRHLAYDTFYLAGEGNLTPALDLRASLSAYVGDQLNPRNPYGWDGRSVSVEGIYKLGHGNTLATGLSRYTNVTTYAHEPNGQRLQVTSLSLSWRKDWPAAGMYTVLQATRSLDESTTRKGLTTQRQGNAFGLRVARPF